MRRNGLGQVCFAVGTKADLTRWAGQLGAQGVPHSGVYDIEALLMEVVNFCDPDGTPIELLSID